MERVKLIDRMYLFEEPILVTPEEDEYVTYIMGEMRFDEQNEYSLTIDITPQHLANYIINLKRRSPSISGVTLNDLEINNEK